MLNFLVAEAKKKCNWPKNVCYMFKEGKKIMHWGGWVSVTGRLPTLSFCQVKSCSHIPGSTQMLKCCGRDFTEPPLIVYIEAPWLSVILDSQHLNVGLLP